MIERKLWYKLYRYLGFQADIHYIHWVEPWASLIPLVGGGNLSPYTCPSSLLFSFPPPIFPLFPLFPPSDFP